MDPPGSRQLFQNARSQVRTLGRSREHWNAYEAFRSLGEAHPQNLRILWNLVSLIKFGGYLKTAGKAIVLSSGHQ